MKVKILAAMLVIATIGFTAACGKKKDLSSAKAITAFVVDGVNYEINETTKTITHAYSKVSAGDWGEPAWPVAPQITLSPKASISPAADEPQDFVANKVTYTVTAEDGSKVTYTVQATRGIK